ncbi:MAG: TIGR00282 family metallophosphoesterase [Bacillota bacterium]
MRLLMIGDVVGRPGRRACRVEVEHLVRDHGVDLVIANGENAAGGNGITREIANELFSCGIDVLTMGNHVWDKKEILGFIEQEARLLRPANYPPGTPGVGYAFYRSRKDHLVAVINLSGRVYLANLECPFRTVNRLLDDIRKYTPVVLVDFHAEATSEKIAMGWYLDGKVSAVCGTHTHVQTADERILPRGTAYISDVGMTGPRDSIIGVKVETVLEKFLTQMPRQFQVAGGPYQFNAVLVTVDPDSGKALNISRIQGYEPPS